MGDLNGVYDPSGIPDDEIVQRMDKLRRYIHYQYSQGYATSAQSMELTLAILEEEYEARTKKKQKEAEIKASLYTERGKTKLPDEAMRKNKTDVINIGRIEGEDNV